jgi:hypothetical protein
VNLDSDFSVIRNAQSANELSDNQRKFYKADLLDYQIWDKYSNKITHEIKMIDDAIKLSARQYISSNEIASSTRKILQTLISRYKLTDVKMIKQIHEQF